MELVETRQPRSLAAAPHLAQRVNDHAPADAERLVDTKVEPCVWAGRVSQAALVLACLGASCLLLYTCVDQWLSSSEGYMRIYLLMSLSFFVASGLRRGLVIIKEQFDGGVRTNHDCEQHIFQQSL